MPAIIAAAEDLIQIVIVVGIFLVVGLAKLIKFLIEQAKQAMKDTSGQGKDRAQASGQAQRRPARQQRRRVSREDLWEVEVDESPEQSLWTPTKKPPVPPPVPDTIDQYSKQSIDKLESLDDRIERENEAAYNYDPSDVPKTDAYGLKRRRVTEKKRRAKVRLQGRRDARRAIITREILERPRCFDI